MKDNADLLHDVLAEASPPDFHPALLGELLRLARRRRRRRHAQRLSGAVVLALVAACLVWEHRAVKTPASRTVAEKSARRSYQLIETQPLPANEIVATRDFAEVKTISSQAAMPIIATRSGGFRFINDAQLIAILEPRPVVLVRTGPDSEKLVFADLAELADSQKGSPAN